MLGIKGSGMSSLSIILKQLGHDVSGSDVSKKSFTEVELENNNLICNDFSIKNLEGVELLIVGHSFINTDNIELVFAKEHNIRTIEYNQYLSQLISNYYSIAVSGSNGKTTTTGLIACILDAVEDTSYLIGNSQGKGNYKSKYFVFEACEHKEHFLVYKPNVVLVNNIDYDHVDYYKTREDYIKAFYKFISNSKDKVVVNGDDDNLKSLSNVIFFGINNKSMFNARNIRYENGAEYDLYYKDDKLGHVSLAYYGEYMVYDSLAALTVALCLGVDINVAITAIKKFNGLKRRFKETIVNDDVYIDDYAHHPSKIKATIEAVKQKYPRKKIIAFFRPDRVPRLNYFSSSFAEELLKADKAYILPFINNKHEEKESINTFIFNYPDIELADNRVYKMVSEYNGVCYLMMSSKDMSEVKESILKYKGDYCEFKKDYSMFSFFRCYSSLPYSSY